LQPEVYNVTSTRVLAAVLIISVRRSQNGHFGDAMNLGDFSRIDGNFYSEKFGNRVRTGWVGWADRRMTVGNAETLIRETGLRQTARCRRLRPQWLHEWPTPDGRRHAVPPRGDCSVGESQLVRQYDDDNLKVAQIRVHNNLPTRH